jgi:hypothetical protein
MRGASGQQEVAKTHPCTLAYFEVLFYPSPPNLELAYMKKKKKEKIQFGVY